MTDAASEPADFAEPSGLRARSQRRVGLLALCLLALAIGLGAGLGAVVLRGLMGLIHNVFYAGVLSFHYDANLPENPSPYGDFVLLSPILGEEALAFVALGALCGLASYAFIRLLVVMEDGFPKLPGGEYVQNVVGMAIIGLMMGGLTRAFGHSYIDGVGYSVIQKVLNGEVTATGLLAQATTISLGCGASGGIFSPSLYLGATLGAAFAAAVGLALPDARLTGPSAANVAMAAMVGAGTGGVMTAIVMIFEMTRDYAVIVPVIVAVAVAAGVRRALIGETIYTVKLRHRGHRIPKERHINLYLVQQAQDVMERRFHLVKAGTSLREALGGEVEDDLRTIVVERDGRIAGLAPPRSSLWRDCPNPSGGPD